jgi:hypothetical protein
MIQRFAEELYSETHGSILAVLSWGAPFLLLIMLLWWLEGTWVFLEEIWRLRSGITIFFVIILSLIIHVPMLWIVLRSGYLLSPPDTRILTKRRLLNKRKVLESLWDVFVAYAAFAILSFYIYLISADLQDALWRIVGLFFPLIGGVTSTFFLGVIFETLSVLLKYTIYLLRSSIK